MSVTTDMLRQQIAAQEKALANPSLSPSQKSSIQSVITSLKAKLTAESMKEAATNPMTTTIITTSTPAMPASYTETASVGVGSKLPLILGGVAVLGGVGFVLWRRRKAQGLSGINHRRCRCR